MPRARNWQDNSVAIHKTHRVRTGAIGGVFVGLGGLIFPQALGVGYDTIRQLLQGNAPLAIFGKSFKSKRYVPLSDRMRRLLRLRNPGDSPWVFPSKRAGCGHLTTINKQWTATVEAVNLDPEQKLPPLPTALKLYCARHTWGTDMLAEGMDIVKVSKLMGHEDLKTTMKYLHPDTSDAASVVNQRNRSKSMHLLEAAG